MSFMRPEMRAVFPGFPSIARYALNCRIHVEIGNPVQASGPTNCPRDSVHADKHGAFTVPLEGGKEICETAGRVLGPEHRAIDPWRSLDFNLDFFLNFVGG